MDDNQLVRKFRKELNSGIVALVLLATLSRSEEPLYGYQIAKSLEGLAQEGVPVKQGTLYPVLRSLEESGLLASRVEPSVSGPPRRYYEITALGRDTLGAWKMTWEQTKQFVASVLEENHG
jgi:PadR family transcriptional regulator PadR